MSFKENLGRRAAEVEAYLAGCLRDRGIPPRLLASMEYSLLAGGKRLRPVLVLAWNGLLGGTRTRPCPLPPPWSVSIRIR